MTQSNYDCIIVGSGSSGGIAAYILQKAGAKCLLLESGRHYTKDDFPMCEADYTPRLFWGGGAEFNSDYSLAFLRGKCVGGGSVVNAALMDRFDDVAWNDFKAESGVGFFSEEAMDPHYHYAEENMGLQTIPDEQRNQNALLFIKAMDNCGHVWKPLRRGQKDCAIEEGNDCISCLGGCHRGSKQSTLETSIPRAMAIGLEVRDQVHVNTISRRNGGYVLHAKERGVAAEFSAPKIVLAGGAFGSTGLMLNSGFGASLPALGQKFAMHPQFMNFAVFDEPVDAHKGVLQGAKSLDPGFRKMGFKLENVFAPPISVAVLYDQVGPDLYRFMQKYRHFACIEVAVRDDNTGTLRTTKNGRLQIDKKLTAQDERRRRDGLRVVKEMFQSVGAKEIIQCPFGFGLHLMGGCRIGTDGASAVVDPEFQVFGFPGLYCADGAVFPNAPGVNPALSIMALTHRMASQVAAKG
nr:GMC family oxidoreductase [uncultured bacterium]